MKWKFWQRKEKVYQGAGSKNKKLSKPRDLPQVVGGYLVVEKNLDPDWIWSLKCMLRQQEGKKTAQDIRIFNREAAAEKGVNLTDYSALDAHPELILYEGYYDEQSLQVHIESSMKKAV